MRRLNIRYIRWAIYAKTFGGNDTHEMELRCLWAHFGVSGHLHTRRGHGQHMGILKSKEMTPQWPSITTWSGSACHSRLAWVSLCFMAGQFAIEHRGRQANCE